jgi:hypothetical protein
LLTAKLAAHSEALESSLCVIARACQQPWTQESPTAIPPTQMETTDDEDDDYRYDEKAHTISNGEKGSVHWWQGSQEQLNLIGNLRFGFRH